jgi:hypothetical protein
VTIRIYSTLYKNVNVQHNLFSRAVPLNPDQLLLRGAQLRNTQWIYGELGIALL